MSNGVDSHHHHHGGGGVINHSPKSHGAIMSPGSVPLPGMAHNGGVSVTVSNGSNGYSTQRTIYSPDSPPTPLPPPAHHSTRPTSLNSKTGAAGKSGGGGGSSSNGGGKRTRWLLCYHVGGGGPGDSPSPPSEHGHSQCSTPSPTDHGFKLPNSFSNERPTSLPVALLSCAGGSSGGCTAGPGACAGLANGNLPPPGGESLTAPQHGSVRSPLFFVSWIFFLLFF